MKTVTLIGNYDNVFVEDRLYERHCPVTLPDAEYKATPALHSPELFSCREAIMTDLIPYIYTSTTILPLDVTVIIPNFRTLDLTRRAVESFRSFYPDVPMILADDGSRDASTMYIQLLAWKDEHIGCLVKEHNVGHGAIVHEAMQMVTTPYVFILDSDTITHRGGFLELMQAHLIEQSLYAIGVLYVRDASRGNRYLSCVASMYDMVLYRTLPPFIHHGDPMQQNMDEADRRGLQVACFPIFDYVEHLERGTRCHYGNRWDLTCES